MELQQRLRGGNLPCTLIRARASGLVQISISLIIPLGAANQRETLKRSCGLNHYSLKGAHLKKGVTDDHLDCSLREISMIFDETVTINDSPEQPSGCQYRRQRTRGCLLNLSEMAVSLRGVQVLVRGLGGRTAEQLAVKTVGVSL